MASHSRVSRPCTRTTPASGTSSRLTSLRTVVLPAPLVPRRATVSPASTLNVNPSRMGVWRACPKDTVSNSMPPIRSLYGAWAHGRIGRDAQGRRGSHEVDHVIAIEAHVLHEGRRSGLRSRLLQAVTEAIQYSTNASSG